MPMKYKQENVVGGLFPSEKCQGLVECEAHGFWVIFQEKEKNFPQKGNVSSRGKSSVKARIMVPSEEDLGKLSSPHLD